MLKSLKLDLGKVFKVIGSVKIGRNPEENDIIIPDKAVSRKHAEITFAGGNFYIQDLKSTYGTKVDDKKVTSAGVILYDGAKILLGTGTVMEFSLLDFGKEEDPEDKTMIYKQD